MQQFGCACSSEDRVLVSGTKGRWFDSSQARFPSFTGQFRNTVYIEKKKIKVLTIILYCFSPGFLIYWNRFLKEFYCISVQYIYESMGD